jgi:tetratricopeptide (TPR) repeat protein
MTQLGKGMGLYVRRLLLLCMFLFGISYFVTAQGKRLIQSKAGQEALFQEGMRHYIKEDYSEAIMVWESLASVISNEPALSFYLAKAYLAEKNPKSALVHARKAHELSPYSLDYGLFFAEQLLADKQISEAIACLTKLSQYDESHPEVNLLLAQAYVWSEQGDLALQALDRADHYVGEYPAIIRTKEFIYLKQNQLLKALQAGKRLIDMDDEEQILTWDQMDVAWDLSQADSVKAELISLQKKYPSQGQLALLLTNGYLHQKNFDSSIVQLRRAAEDHEVLPSMVAQVTMKVFELIDDPIKWEQANSLATHWLAIYPDEPRFIAIQGDLYVSASKLEAGQKYYLRAARMGEPKYEVWARIIQLDFELNAVDSAATHAMEALKAFPMQGFLNFQLGFARYLQGNNADALRYLEVARGIIKPADNWNVQLFSMLGDVYHATGRPKDSDMAFDKVLALNPTDEHVLNNYSYYLSLRKERLEKAVVMSRQLIEKYPTESTYLDTYAWVLYQQGKYEEAFHYLSLAVADEKSQSSAVWEHHGDALYRLGRITEAVASWEKARALPNANLILDKKIKMRQIVEN